MLEIVLFCFVTRQGSHTHTPAVSHTPICKLGRKNKIKLFRSFASSSASRSGRGLKSEGDQFIIDERSFTA